MEYHTRAGKTTLVLNADDARGIGRKSELVKEFAEQFKMVPHHAIELGRQIKREFDEKLADEVRQLSEKWIPERRNDSTYVPEMSALIEQYISGANEALEESTEFPLRDLDEDPEIYPT